MVTPRSESFSRIGCTRGKLERRLSSGISTITFLRSHPDSRAISAKEFAEYALLGGSISSDTGVKEEDGIPYFEFTQKDPNSGEKVRYLVTFYKSEKAFWDVQFCSLEKDFSKMRSTFVKWAKSVSFGE